MRSSKTPRQWAGFRSVLCAVDFSDHARTALRHAATLARRGDASLTVVYANDPLLIAAAAAALHDRQMARRSGAELKTFVDRTLGESQKDLRVKTVAAVGHPRDVILKTASRSRADLIVLGTHGLTGADRLFMGSTALDVLQRSTVPVLAVPHTHDGGPSASWPGSEIVAAVELDAGTAAEAEHAARIAEWFGSTLLLLHVVSPIAPPRWFEGDLSALEETRTARAQQQIDKLAAAVKRRVTARTKILHGVIADEIAKFAAAAHTGLVITALRDRTGWFGARRGSISYHVLSRAAAPVLAYPPRWRPR